MSRHLPQFTWQPLDTMPEERFVEVMRASGARRLACRTQTQVLGIVFRFIVSVPDGQELTDVIAWRDCPGVDPMPQQGQQTSDEERLAA